MGLLARIQHGIRHPDRIYPYVRRLTRDAKLRFLHRNHVSYYRAVMAHDSADDPNAAVGSANHRRWLKLGKMQFDYLVEHGLTPQDRMLEIGCGNLRAGWRFISYLEKGHYYGIDISPDILLSAQRTLRDYELQNKLANVTLVNDLKMGSLPRGYFTVINAHSVFSHCPLDVIEECFANVSDVLAPGGFFDFTFNRATGREHHVLREDYYYRTETLLDLAAKYSLRGRFMEDWEELPHKQSKIRLVRESDTGREPDEGTARRHDLSEASH
ncbi:methyltransferase family protein [Haloactinospora alba]|uniref:Methyltransferase family protein n=2 Tax=Haloactinospora alba TaxID=405555 RepID=A0A543NIT9_9ACTN|nr:methyltransferase family protein [Haloactinospora alba]